MVKDLQKIEIFVSSPSDVSEERQEVVKAIKELNGLQHINSRYQLQALIYEIETPGVVGDSPQRTVDHYMAKAEDVDIFVCILWSRMGTPVLDPDTGIQYQSGTHYEFVHAYEANQKNGTPIILLYRCKRQLDADIDFEQALKVQQFFKEFENKDGKYQGLYKPYVEIDEFSQIIKNDISKVLTKISANPTDLTSTQLNQHISLEAQLQMYLSLVIKLNSQISYQPNLPMYHHNWEFEKIGVELRLSEPKPIPTQVSALQNALLDTNVSTQGSQTQLSLLSEQSDPLVIFGEMGSGKTLLMKKLSTTLANQNLESKDTPVPIYISGLELALYLESLDTAFSGSHETPFWIYQRVMEAVFHQTFDLEFWTELFNNYPIIFILDGLSEIANHTIRLYLMDALTQLRQRYPRFQVVVTMRPQAFTNDLFSRDYRYVAIQGLNQDQQTALMDKLDVVLKDSIPEDTKLYRDKVFRLNEQKEIAKIISTPLFFSVAYLSYLDKTTNHKLLQSIVYERVIDLKLNDWDLAKLRNARVRVGVIGTSLETASNPTDEELLAYTAWKIYSSKTKSLEIDTLIDWMQEFNADKTRHQIRQILSDRLYLLEEHSNILSISTQQLSFGKLLDVIYLAGMYFKNDPKRWQKLESYLSNVIEHEDFLFAIFDLQAMENIHTATMYIEYLLNFCETLSIQQQQAEVIDYIAKCFIRVSDQMLDLRDPITKKILDIIEDIDQKTNLETRIKLGRSLGLIGDPRIGTNMVLVAEGKFIMGYDMFDEDRPARRVFVPHFYIDKYPVTNAQFASFIEDGGYQNQDYWCEEGWEWVQSTKREHPQYWHDEKFNFPNYPVVGVSWYEASAYAKWAGKRLPTEEEWEKATRGSDRGIVGRSWAWGNEFRSDFVNSAEGDNPVNGTTPIGIYPAGASAFGIYDLCGNVSEWTSDWFKAYENNPYQDSHFGENFIVRRGGGWGVDQDFVRSTCRIGSTPDADYAVIGFRCAATMRP